jgi:tetratricopeptide (TPR) repeat protein
MTDFGGTQYVRLQLINNHLNWKWVGVLHEYLDCPEARAPELLKGIYNFPRCEGARSQDPEKFKKDAAVLEKALESEPENERYVFYLAQSYRDAGDPVLAIKNYEKRIAMGGWDQEVFFSKYQICLLQEQLQSESQKIIKGYLDCFASRPTRAEPLCRLATLYRMQGDHLLGYLVASYGLSIPRPEDTLFVECWVYEYGLLLEKSISAYWIGNYRESLELSHKLLENTKLPDHVRECVQNNIRWAEAKIIPERRITFIPAQ